MTAPYAKAVVTAELDWGNVSEEFETRVRIAAEKAAKAAQKHFDRIKLAAKVDLNANTALFKTETQARLDNLRLTAKVTLNANTAEFRRETQARLDKIRLTANVTLNADTAKFRAAVQNISARARVTLDPGPIQPLVRDIETRLRAARITAPVFLSVANEAEFRAHIATLTQTVTQHVNIVTHGGGGGGGGGAGGLRSLDFSLGNIAKKSLKLTAISALIGAIGGAAGIAAGAVGALVAGLGAVGVAGAAGMATTLVGMKGIGDAFSAFSSESSSAASDAASKSKAIAAAQKGVEQANRGVEQANRGVESAERSVARANKDSQNAQKDLTQAREDAVRQIEDLNFALKGTAIDERDAELALARAREAYDKTFSDPKASALDRAEAALGVDKALRRQEETLIRNADIEKDAQKAAQQGVEGSDKVVAAKEKIADAAEGVADAERGLVDAHREVTDAQDAVIEAQANLQDAMTSTSGAADKTAEALAKLSPNARSFVLAMRELGPEWESVRKSVQDNMFAGLDVAFSDLATTSMPMLKEGMGQVGTSINGAAKEFAAFWGSAGAQDSLKNIFAGTADLITAMQPGLAALTTGILDIGNAAAPVMGQLGDSLGNLLGSIGEAFTEAFMDGSLTELLGHFSTMMDGLGGGLNALLGGLIDFGNIVGPILGPLLQTFGEAIAALAPSLGQLGLVFGEALIQVLPILSQFISALADGLTPIMPILADLIGSLGAALTPLISPLSQIIQVIGTALVGAVDALAPAIGPLGEAFAALVTALAPILPLVAEVIGMLVSALAPALTTIFEAFAPVIKQLVDGLKPIFEALAPVLGQIAGLIADALVTALNALAPFLPQLMNAFTLLVEALLPLIPPILQIGQDLLPVMTQNMGTIMPVVIQVIEILTELINLIMPILIPAIELLGKIVATIFQGMADVIKNVVDNIIQPGIDRFRSGIDSAKTFIGDAVDGIKGFFTGMGDTIGKIWDKVVSGIAKAVGKVGDLMKKVEWVPGAGSIRSAGEKLVGWAKQNGYANGGKVLGAGTGTSDSILARLSHGEFVEPAAAVTPQTLPLLEAIRSGWTPSPQLVQALVYGQSLPGYAVGGVVGSFKELASQHAPGLTLTSAERDTNDYHGQGKAVDYSNGSGNTDEQLAWANFLADNYQDQLSELIYSDPRFTRNIKDGKIVDPSFYGAATMAQHENHVHAAAQEPLGPPTQMPGDEAGMDAGPDTRTNKEKYVDEIISEGKRRGMSEKQIKAAIMAMLAESGGQMYANASDPESLNYAHDAVGSDHDSSGLFQQRNNGAWGTAADRMDPAKSAGMFYEELAKQDESSMSEAQLAQAVQRSAFSDGSNYAAKQSEAETLIAESNARGNGAAASSADASADAGTAQQVFVTNWPSSMGGGSSALTSAATAAAASSGPSTTSPVVVSAATSAAFDPNNTGYDASFYNDTVPRGDKAGADAWLARQDFTPQIRGWGIDMLKEVGGEFAEPWGLAGQWGKRVDESAAMYARQDADRQFTAQQTGGGNTVNVTFNGYNGTPQQFMNEMDRLMRTGMSALTPM